MTSFLFWCELLEDNGGKVELHKSWKRGDFIAKQIQWVFPDSQWENVIRYENEQDMEKLE